MPLRARQIVSKKPASPAKIEQEARGRPRRRAACRKFRRKPRN